MGIMVSNLGFVESEAYYLAGMEWKLGRVLLENKLFKIPVKTMLISEVTKIKLFKEPAINSSRKLKITHNHNTDYHFSLEAKVRFG